MGEQIFAQIDIDSHRLAAFDDEAVLLVQAVADRLARVYAARRSNDHQLGAA